MHIKWNEVTWYSKAATLLLLTALTLGGLVLGVEYDKFSSKPLRGVVVNTVPTDRSEKMELIFAGDGMFDRYVRKIGEREGYAYLFHKASSTLREVDGTVFNLEGPITGQPSRSVGTTPDDMKHFSFTFSPAVVDILKNLNIAAVNLGNNHIGNFGAVGVSSTKTYLKKSGIDYFGNTGFGAPRTTVLEKNGVKVGIVGYNQFTNESPGEVRRRIRSAQKTADSVVVYAHWDREYEALPMKHTRQLARSFVGAGADLVVGSHPHVIQLAETYKNKRIYYSLGNFVFDQFFSPQTRCGLVLKVEFSDDGIKKIDEREIWLMDNGQITFRECR